MDLFTYLMAKKGHNTHRDLFSYLLGKNAGGSGTYTTFSGTSLNISNTLQAKIKNIALEGNTSQDGTPTPEAPIPIKVVTGEQNIIIQSKNLFDKSNYSNYRIVSRTTGELVQNNSFGTTDYIKVKANQTYYQSNVNAYYSVLYDENKEYYGIIGTEKFTPAIDGYIRTSFSRSNLNLVQVEIGEVATTYVPYQTQTYPLSLGNIELARISNYKDYIFKNVTGSPYYNADLELNGWYLHKENIIQNLWQMNWIYDSEYSTPVPRTVLRLEGMISRGNYLSNCFLSSEMDNQQITNRLKTNSSKWFIALANSLTGIETTDSSGTKLNKIITYLQSVSANIYYGLATPTYTKITDTTLITQLENLNNARSYKDTTIIECSSESADNEVIGFSGDIKVTSVGLGNSLNTSLLSNEEPNLDDVNEIEDIEQNDEPIENEETEEEVS